MRNFPLSGFYRAGFSIGGSIWQRPALPPKKTRGEDPRLDYCRRDNAPRPWSDAVSHFYERMTDVAWWRRAVLEPVLGFLSRFIPGRDDSDALRVSKAIKAGETG